MSDATDVVSIIFEDPEEAAYVGKALAAEGIETEVELRDLETEQSLSTSSAGSCLLVAPENRARAVAVFTELRTYQYLKGWGESHPGYMTPMQDFVRQVKRLRIVHKTHIGSVLVLIVLSVLTKGAEVFQSVPVPRVLSFLVVPTSVLVCLSLFIAAWSKCPRCKKLFHHHLVLFTIFETQCLNCGFHLWNEDGI